MRTDEIYAALMKEPVAVRMGITAQLLCDLDTGGYSEMDRDEDEWSKAFKPIINYIADYLGNMLTSKFLDDLINAPKPAEKPEQEVDPIKPKKKVGRPSNVIKAAGERESGRIPKSNQGSSPPDPDKDFRKQRIKPNRKGTKK